MTERVHESEWFRQTVDELRQYRVLKKRIDVIEIQLRRHCGPDARAIANYGIGTAGGQNADAISPLEVELEEKQTRLQALEKSFEALDRQEREVVELKFLRGHSDKEIYGEKVFMSSSTYYEYHNRAVTKIAKCLGFLEC